MSVIEICCKDFLARLSDYVDEELEKQFREAIDEHAATCPRCKVVLDTLGRTITVFQEGTEAASIPAGAHERLMEAIAAERAKMASEQR
jgi:anti-sigma factor RsiW